MNKNEKELLKKCTPTLNFFDNYFKENELGKKVYESAKAHIYSIEYINDLTIKELIFQTIINHYYGQYEDYKYLEKAMLNYFMIKFTGNHKKYFNTSKFYGQKMYNNLLKHCKKNNHFELYLDNNNKKNGDTMTEQELIEECKIYLDCLDHFMRDTTHGKMLWCAVAPYIYQYRTSTIQNLESTFTFIINYYFQKSNDKINNCIDNLMLNYCMLNYAISNEPKLCEQYGKNIYNNSKNLKQNPEFLNYYKNRP
jgi:hypothetical protein